MEGCRASVVGGAGRGGAVAAGVIGNYKRSRVLLCERVVLPEGMTQWEQGRRDLYLVQVIKNDKSYLG